MVLTSIYEGLPNVILEALTLNKFVISSNCPTGPAEILDNGKGGLLFRTKDHKDLGLKMNDKILQQKITLMHHYLTEEHDDKETSEPKGEPHGLYR